MIIPLPIVDGVGPSCVRVPGGPWRNILEYLEERFPDVQSATWIARIKKGKVADEFGTPLNAESPCRRGGFIFYYRELEQETPIPFEERILFQDDHLLITDKPHFLPVVPSGRFLHETLLVRLKKRLNLEHLVPLHRIDREAAGLVMFSCNPRTRSDYASLFPKRKVRKVYEALAPTLRNGHFPMTHRSCMARGQPFFRMKEVEGLPNSETSIDVLKIMGDKTLYRLIPLTGRKHQLRVHLSTLGIPIINDKFYPDVQPFEADNFSCPLMLLAKSFSFQDPLTGHSRYFESSRRIQEVHR